MLGALEEYIVGPGMGQICEVFDGEAPYRPRACYAQAWSVSELLRTAVEDVFAGSQPSAHSFQPSFIETDTWQLCATRASRADEASAPQPKLREVRT
jgi:glycogen debranching enzyme